MYAANKNMRISTFKENLMVQKQTAVEFTKSFTESLKHLLDQEYQF